MQWEAHPPDVDRGAQTPIDYVHRRAGLPGAHTCPGIRIISNIRAGLSAAFLSSVCCRKGKSDAERADCVRRVDRHGQAWTCVFGTLIETSGGDLKRVQEVKPSWNHRRPSWPWLGAAYPDLELGDKARTFRSSLLLQNHIYLHHHFCFVLSCCFPEFSPSWMGQG